MSKINDNMPVTPDNKRHDKKNKKTHESDGGDSGDDAENQNFAELLYTLFPSKNMKKNVDKFNKTEKNDKKKKKKKIKEEEYGSESEEEEKEEEEEENESEDSESSEEEDDESYYDDSDEDYIPEEDSEFDERYEEMFSNGKTNSFLTYLMELPNARHHSEFYEYDPEYSESDEGTNNYSGSEYDKSYSEESDEESIQDDELLERKMAKIKKEIKESQEEEKNIKLKISNKNKKSKNQNSKMQTKKKVFNKMKLDTSKNKKLTSKKNKKRTYKKDNDEKNDEEQEDLDMQILSMSSNIKKSNKKKKEGKKEGKKESKKEGKKVKDEKRPGKKAKKYRIGDRVMVKMSDWDRKYRGTIISKKEINGKKKKASRTRMTDKRNKKPQNFVFSVRLDDKQYETVKNVKLENIYDLQKEDKKTNKSLNDLDKMLQTYDGKDKDALMENFKKMSTEHTKRSEEERKKREKKEQKENTVKLQKLIKDKNVMNDFTYFKKLGVGKQKSILEKLEEVNKYSNIEKPYRISVLDSNIPTEFKSIALKKLNSLSYLDPGSGEYYRLKQWVDTFMRLPFNNYCSLPVSIDDGPEKCKEFMTTAKKHLDDAVYGLEDAKMQIMQMMGQWISNPDSLGTAIAIKGPMGTGKTTLVKEGISKILNRPFAFIALGGATDSSFLEGHSYTYEGSLWGKIVDIILQCKCMNPVIYFDELDKISNTPKGEEIIGILTHLTDTTQNDQFHDKYFSNIHFNLSKAMFIFSYNEEHKVNPILKDRMYRIETKGYDSKDKTVISNNYLIPKIKKSVNFKEEDIIIPDETIEYIAKNLTDKEKGVRNLKRALEIIHTKLNLYRLMDGDTQLFNKEKTLDVKFPFTVTKDIVNKLIKKKESETPLNMYI